MANMQPFIVKEAAEFSCAKIDEDTIPSNIYIKNKAFKIYLCYKV